VRQPSRRMGATAATLLIEELADPDGFRARSVVYEPQLIVRASTSTPTGKNS
jgi:LacI family transcriptional regulator